MKQLRMLPVILVTIAATLLAVLVFRNFSTGEKKIERRVERLYTVTDPDFARAMGVLLGPAIIGGNRV